MAKVLVDKWFHVYGIPAWIHSDQGKSFDNEILDHLCAMYGVEHTMTAPYNPPGNSQCERFNRTMYRMGYRGGTFLLRGSIHIWRETV